MGVGEPTLREDPLLPVSELRQRKTSPEECVRSAGERRAGAGKQIQDGVVKRKRRVHR
jgi:hypothetical protein